MFRNVRLYRCKSGPYSIVVASEDMTEARDVAAQWAQANHGDSTASVPSEWRIDRARSVPDGTPFVTAYGPS